MFNTLIMGFVVSLAAGIILGPVVIKKLKAFHARQEEREEGPESHKYKAGTPTMGGILILFLFSYRASPLTARIRPSGRLFFLRLAMGSSVFWMIPLRP